MENRPLEWTWGESGANKDEHHPCRAQGGRDQLRPAAWKASPWKRKRLVTEAETNY
ncbi:hypothetical protein [Alkalicoccus halolimnae]|uniref:Uncharacterized protein n=1 Tax=Alkalicoccus halolimnae TaxID=1667239 RepID=A0AAJ8LSH9_9BACI|nr:hypothetical protein [Alkalicoccus halolimnae]